MADISAIARAFRQRVLEGEDAAVEDILARYAEAQRRIQERADALLDRIEMWREGHIDEAVPWWVLFEQERLEALERQIVSAMQRFSRTTLRRLEREQRRLVGEGVRDAERMTREVLGELPPGMAVAFASLPTEVVEAMVGRLQDGSPLSTLLDEMGPEASRAIRVEIVQGLMLGENPRDVAGRVAGVLDVGRARAELIARTEMLRAYREATLESYRRNSDVVRGWVWHSACDTRTCEMCWAMHGTEHGLDEELDDHPNGRCAAIPITWTWRELGYDVPGTRPTIETGEDRFARLSGTAQRAILGNAAYEAYRAGVVTLPDFVGRRFDTRWGSMRYARSLREILGATEARRWYMRGVAARRARESKPSANANNGG